jgi:hypothetical protein
LTTLISGCHPARSIRALKEAVLFQSRDRQGAERRPECRMAKCECRMCVPWLVEQWSLTFSRFARPLSNSPPLRLGEGSGEGLRAHNHQRPFLQLPGSVGFFTRDAIDFPSFNPAYWRQATFTGTSVMVSLPKMPINVTATV